MYGGSLAVAIFARCHTAAASAGISRNVLAVVRHLRAVEGATDVLAAAAVDVPVLAKTSSARPGEGTLAGRSRGGTEQGVDGHDAGCR